MSTTHELPSGASVVFRDNLTGEDVEEYSRYTHLPDGDGGHARDGLRAAMRMAPKLIEEWTLTDSEGEPLPITLAGMRRAPARDVVKIANIIDGMIGAAGLSEED